MRWVSVFSHFRVFCAFYYFLFVSFSFAWLWPFLYAQGSLKPSDKCFLPSLHYSILFICVGYFRIGIVSTRACMSAGTLILSWALYSIWCYAVCSSLSLLSFFAMSFLLCCQFYVVAVSLIFLLLVLHRRYIFSLGNFLRVFFCC